MIVGNAVDTTVPSKADKIAVTERASIIPQKRGPRWNVLWLVSLSTFVPVFVVVTFSWPSFLFFPM
jgi:4-hydroxybenzoate polyprenyltransferase